MRNSLVWFPTWIVGMVWLTGCASSPTVPKPKDPYFGRLTWLLTDPPTSSRKRLKNKPLAEENEREETTRVFELEAARAWALTILRREYQPKGDTPFLAFAQEAGEFDTVRSEYRVGNDRIELAESRTLFSVRIDDKSASSARCTRAEFPEFARKVLALPSHLRFERTGQTADRIYGKILTPKLRGKSNLGTDWLSELRWWCARGSVGFVTLKASGLQSSEFLGANEEFNYNWF